MAGYFEYSKSNNAITAEHNGLFPASVLAVRLGVKVGAIKELLSPKEWHHTSKFYNATNYYSEETALERIEELRAWKEPKKNLAIHENCSGEFLDWRGTRKHPHATLIKFSGIRAEEKGDWFILHLPEGKVKKNKNTRGFVINK